MGEYHTIPGFGLGRIEDSDDGVLCLVVEENPSFL